MATTQRRTCRLLVALVLLGLSAGCSGDAPSTRAIDPDAYKKELDELNRQRARERGWTK
jgi:hypothetical protein